MQHFHRTSFRIWNRSTGIPASCENWSASWTEEPGGLQSIGLQRVGHDRVTNTSTANKASGSDGIPAELFQILKDDAVKVLHSRYQQIWKTQQWPQDWKRSVFIPIPKKGNAKECSNYHTVALISHASKVMLKIFQPRLQQYMNRELSDIQACFRTGRRTRVQIANICWIIEKARQFQKTSVSSLLTVPKPLTLWITRNCGKSWKRCEYQITWPASWEIWCRSTSNS